jgi:hypothetical protein
MDILAFILAIAALGIAAAALGLVFAMYTSRAD